MIPYEVIVRGYMFGSMYEAYKKGEPFLGHSFTKKYEQAEAAYMESLKWNPVNAQATFEYLDLIKRLGRKDEYFQRTINAFQIAFRPEHIAMCYRNIGFYYMRRGKWSAAVNCDLLSLRYDDANEKDIQSELNQICDMYRMNKRQSVYLVNVAKTQRSAL